MTSPTNSGNTLTIVINSVAYTYSLSSGNLVLNGSQLNSYNTTISSLTFTRLGQTTLGKNSIKINLTLQSRLTRKGGVTDSKNFQTTIAIR